MTGGIIKNFDRKVIYRPSTKRGRPFIAHTTTHQLILFMTCVDDYAERTEQNLVVRIGKSEDEVTNNKRLCSIYYTVEANYMVFQKK